MSTKCEAVPEPAPQIAVDRRPRSVDVSMQGAGMLWFAAWLFTIGFAQLGFWRAALALLLWPYFIGVLAR
jgi:hypothetical protein